jgi:flavin-dependent dehydrogenase
LRSRGSIAIVGGGLAGSALAARLATTGHDVHLFEKGTFPRDKLCGEFLSSEAKSLFERLDCWPAIAALHPVPITRGRFSSPGGQGLELVLPAEGLGLSRRALDGALFAHAQCSGAKVHIGSDVRSIEPAGGQFLLSGEVIGPIPARLEHRADLVVAAYGRRARLDHTLERAFAKRAHPHLGLKQHHRPRPGRLGESLTRELEGHVEIHAVPGGYCGMSFVEGGRVNVCSLVEESFFRGLPDRSMPTVLATLASKNSALARRLEALEPEGSEPLSVAQVPFQVKEPAKDGVLFIGDAAGMVAPLAGNGQAMALESALLLADLIDRHGVPRSEDQRDRLARAWSLRWTLKYRARLELGRGLQTLLLRAPAADRALQLLGSAPALTKALVRLTRSRG